MIGFLFGGLGLGIYLWSVVDDFIPIAIVIILWKLIGGAGILGAAVVAGLYGFARVTSSNERLAAQDAVARAEVNPGAKLGVGRRFICAISLKPRSSSRDRGFLLNAAGSATRRLSTLLAS